MIGTLTVTSSHVVCSSVDVRRDGSYCILSESQVAFPGIRKGRNVSGFGLQTAVAQAVGEAEEIAKGRIKELHVGVPGAFCEVQVSSSLAQADGYGEQTVPQAHEYMNDTFELIHRMPWPNKGLAQYGRGDSISILARRDYIAEINRALDTLRMRPAAFYSQNLAEGLYIIPRSSREQVAILLNVGYYNSNICIFLGDVQIYGATLYLGGAHIASDLAYVLELDRSQAEQLTRQFAFGIHYESDAQDYIRMPDGKLSAFEHQEVEQIILSRMDEICALMGQAVEQSGFPITESTVAYLLGDGLRDLRGSREYISAQIGIPVKGLPLAINDGATRYETASLALLELLLQKRGAQTKQSRFFNRFARK